MHEDPAASKPDAPEHAEPPSPTRVDVSSLMKPGAAASPVHDSAHSVPGPAAPPVLEAGIPLDEAGRIAAPIPCRACGYTLAGLRPDGMCPECSGPIARSIRGDLLRFADPAWLNRLTSGVLWIIIGTLGGTAVGILAAALGIALAASGMPIAVGSVLAAIPPLLTVYGGWLLTTPDPVAGANSGLTVRVVTRYCLLAGIAATPLQIASGNTSIGGNVLSNLNSADLLITAVGILASIIALVGQMAGLIYLRRLALRVPSTAIAKQTRIVFWGYLCTAGLGLLLGALAVLSVAALAGGTAPAAALVALVAVGCTVAIGSVVFGIWAIVLLFLYHNLFRTAAQQATRAWNPLAPT